MERVKRYYVCDAHFGVDNVKTSEYRERLFIQWLDDIKDDALEINLLGDIFDFWFEYKYVIPKGYSEIFTKLKQLNDSGISIKYYTGNHDMWIFDYIPKVTGATIIRNVEKLNINGKVLLVGHGDGLGDYDKKYNVLKKIFANKFLQFLFRNLNPGIGFRIALAWSNSSRKKHIFPTKINYDEEWLVKYSREVLKKEHIDFFLFGHRHIPFQYKLDSSSLFTNVGDWLFNFTYAVFDGENVELRKYGN